MNVMEGELWELDTKTISPEVFLADMKVTLMPDVKMLDSFFVEKLNKEYGSAEIITWVIDDRNDLERVLMTDRKMSLISNNPVYILFHMNKFYKKYCQLTNRG